MRKTGWVVDNSALRSVGPVRPRYPNLVRRLSWAALVAAVLVSVLLLAVVPAAASQLGSDSPTPYSLTHGGIELPAGFTVTADAHFNGRYVVDGVEHSFGFHVEGKCGEPYVADPGFYSECVGQPAELASLIGADLVPWSALSVPADGCVVWLQLWAFDEHFGEGGQEPFCLTPTSTPTPTPVATSPSPPPTSTPEPTSTATPAPSNIPVAVDCSPGLVLVHTPEGDVCRMPVTGPVRFLSTLLLGVLALLIGVMLIPVSVWHRRWLDKHRPRYRRKH
jgi:hypothetical protein